MTAEYELSVCVITMNRAEQLKEALESCVACKLPEKTEFVVLDNASTDDTELKVEEFKNAHPDIRFRCFFSEKNFTKKVLNDIIKSNFVKVRRMLKWFSRITIKYWD